MVELILFAGFLLIVVIWADYSRRLLEIKQRDERIYENKKCRWLIKMGMIETMKFSIRFSLLD